MTVSKMALLALIGVAANGGRMKERRFQGEEIQVADKEEPDISPEDLEAILDDVSEEVFDDYEENDDPWEEDDFVPDPETRFGSGGDDFDLSQFDTCHLSESSCSIQDMKKPTIVYTDSSDTRCWNGDGFGFLVHPGATDKLLYYFPGGGACWDQPNVFIPGSAKLCKDTFKKGIAATGYGQGVMDFSKSGNPFKEYTVVSPAYCSGGLHLANVTVKNAFGTGYQHDYNSNKRTIDWAEDNLDRSLSSLVLLGSSAGAIGVLAWADYFLSTFTYTKASVLFDSYVGVFPSGTPGKLIPNFGACNLPILKPFKAKCDSGKFELTEALTYTIGKHSKVAFGHIQAKVDLIQRIFYSAVALSFFKLDVALTKGRFFKKGNAIMQQCNRFPNYVSYFVRNGQHVFTDSDMLYTSSVNGGGKSGLPPMQEWVTKFIDHQPVTTQCAGKHKGNGYLFGNYCDRSLMGKRLSV